MGGGFSGGDSRRSIRAAGRVASVCAAFLMLASPATAQYFGQNKVHYKRLQFQVLTTEHFDIYFYQEERDAVELAARMAERWHARLTRIFHYTLRGRQPLIVYASHTDFEQTNVILGDLGQGTGGVTEPLRRRIVLPLAGPLSDTDHVIGHELVHAFQFDLTASSNGPRGQNGAERLPLWFVEGMAEYLSLGAIDSNTAMWLRDAVQLKHLPDIEHLRDPQYFPYRWGQAFWAYVCARWGDNVIWQLLVSASAAGNPIVAIERVLGTSARALSDDWHAELRRAYGSSVAALATDSAEVGQAIIKGTELADLNVGPSISPDGRWIAFLSSRSLLSTDLYVADASSGRILRRLTRTATDPHYSSLQFISSAGAWDHDSTRVAIAAVSRGRPLLTIFNAKDGTKMREMLIAGVDEILNPAWAPDDRAICFVGIVGGTTDLFVYDLAASTLRRLTRDAFADLQPAWSPDGRHIAFVTDRFTSKLATLEFGAFHLALIDPETSDIHEVPAVAAGKHMSPQWSPDGRELYFVSDRDGVANVYRLRLESGDVAQLTAVGTGVSGITSSSPALSIAARTGIAAFSVFRNRRYDIYGLDVEHLSGVPRTDAHQVVEAARPTSSEVAQLLATASYGLPNDQSYPVTPYKPSLSLEAVGQPTVSVGATSIGPAVGGGMSLAFGDLLANRTLATALQVGSPLTAHFALSDLAGQIAYFNQAHRWTWALVGGQLPYYSGGFTTATGQVQGEPAELNRAIIYRQTELSASGLVAYPFDRARRVEFQAGVSKLSFDQIIETTAISVSTGSVLSEDIAQAPLARPLDLGIFSGAFVSDTASLGPTSPVQGQRYRLEASPAVGTIRFAGLLADFRRYFMPAPFYTLAVRLLHYGRYGAGAEDPRLNPLYVGYPGLVRGYDVYTVRTSDCRPDPGHSCLGLDRLAGSRILVGNVEVRFPLLRPLGVSQRMYGPVPLEIALFADGGSAWNSGERPFVLGGARDGVSSAGVGVRTLLFGFAVAEVDVVRTLQNGGWRVGFNLIPGF